VETPNAFQKVLLHAIENRLPISLGLSAACGIVLRTLYPVPTLDPKSQEKVQQAEATRQQAETDKASQTRRCGPAGRDHAPPG
jgi:hypothetical protein